MKNINLYIGDSLATVNGEFTFLMNYKFEDFTNPTAIKNNFSRTVALKGDKVNNRIFGHIYNSDMIVSEGTYIDPNKRTPFKLYIDDTLVESGYMQLNNITRDGHGILSYNCTFYGGLGDFFWCLQSDDETGETKKLSDLNYHITDKDGKIIGKETEMDFDITKDFVYDCWLRLGKTGTTLEDTITFVPMYNGKPSGDFSPSKVLINKNNNADFSDVGINDMNGYYGMSLKEGVDEWAARDLRSYLQRPALKISKLFDAIGYAENNGGYELIKDSAWFNSRNPYYNDAYITLPVLSMSENITGVKDSINASLTGNTGQIGTDIAKSVDIRNHFISNDNITCSENGVIDLTHYPYRSSAQFIAEYRLTFTPTDKEAANVYDDLKMDIGSIDGSDQSTAVSMGIRAWNPVGGAWLKNTRMFLFKDGHHFDTSEMYDFVSGKFVKQSDGTWLFTLANGSTTFKHTLDIPSPSDTMCIRERVAKEQSHYSYMSYGLGRKMEDGTAKWFDGNFTVECLPTSTLVLPKDSEVMSGARITKSILFNSDDNKSVLDFVLSYSKKFGLVWIKDKNSKTVRVMTRNTYFQQGKKIDMENLIDFSQDIKTEPLLFDKRFYLFKELDAEDYYSETYNSRYGKRYGQKRVDTGYPFNNDTEDTESDNVYTAMPEVNPLSTFNKYYASKNGNRLPSWATDTDGNIIGMSGGTTGSTTFNVASQISATDGTVWYSNDIGRDWTHRPTTAQDDNSWGNECYGIVLYTGNDTPVNENGNAIIFYLTDDIQEMQRLNGARCWLYTEDENDTAGKRIAIHPYSIPHFSRWITDGTTNVVHSLDWGKPVELFVPKYSMLDETCIYHRFWSNFIRDQYDVNARSLWCHVDLRKFIIDRDLLSNVFWYGNSLWVLNEIQEYDVTKDTTVYCNFIRINDVRNYTNGQQVFGNGGYKGY